MRQPTNLGMTQSTTLVPYRRLTCITKILRSCLYPNPYSLPAISLKKKNPRPHLELNQIALATLLLLRPRAKRIAGALSTKATVHTSWACSSV